jgi:hypothetical protein
MSSPVEGNTPFNIQDIDTNSGIPGPDNANGPSSPTSENEALAAVEGNTPFDIQGIETNSGIPGPDNDNGPSSPTSENEALAAVEGNTPFDIQGIETNSGILGPDNTYSPSSPTSNNEILAGPEPADPAHPLRSRLVHYVRDGTSYIRFSEREIDYSWRIYQEYVRLNRQAHNFYEVLAADPSSKSISRLREWRHCFSELSSLSEHPEIVRGQQRGAAPDFGDYTWQIEAVDKRIVAIQTVEEYTAADPLPPTTAASLTALIQLEIESTLELHEAMENLAEAIADSGI